jgi:lipoprotein-anchoring transpeptidase ErfK/SrfK
LGAIVRADDHLERLSDHHPSNRAPAHRDLARQGGDDRADRGGYRRHADARRRLLREGASPPPTANGPYGPYAYGLSGFSNVLTSFGSGDGVIGIHGTNEPWLIGKDVSHGCIRMRNDDIERLAQFLPLGTPVEIRP